MTYRVKIELEVTAASLPGAIDAAAARVRPGSAILIRDVIDVPPTNVIQGPGSTRSEQPPVTGGL
jgi:hypothetical protein